MPSLNKVMIIGYLGKDPVCNTIASGKSVANFSVATTEYYKVDGESKSKTEWHNVVAWSKTAELCNKLLKKGSLVFIGGKLQTREWENEKGQKRRITEIVVENVQALQKKETKPASAEEQQWQDREIPQPDF